MSTETRLKPCPFCGGAARELNRFNANVITCRRCGVKVRQSEMGQGDAAEQWNKRSTPVSVEPVAQVAAQARPTDDALWDQTLRERDEYHDMADQLAAQIASITGQEIGEHSSDNEPWCNAMLAADEFIAERIRKLCSAPAQPHEYLMAGELAYAAKLTAPVAAQPDITQQTLDDVKAGIPARDAEIKALRTELETLQAQHAATLSSIEAFVACDASAISYLTLGQYRTALLKMLREGAKT